MDKIKITDLEIFAHHGVFREENVLGQKFLVSAVLYTDTRKAAMEDDLKQSIHYGEVSQNIQKFLTEHTYQLLETAAEHTCMWLLENTPHLQKISMEIKKPWAPVGLPLDTVSVEIERGWHKVYLSIGSNMGDRQEYLNRAVAALQEHKQCKVMQVSDYLVTEPYGYKDQEDFLNACIELDTLLMPSELLELLHEIEQSAGRERLIHWGPRTLDMDILYYDDEIIEESGLQIPHTQLHKRQFVLEPLCQIAPYKVHPVFGKSTLQMYEELLKENK